MAAITGIAPEMRPGFDEFGGEDPEGEEEGSGGWVVVIVVVVVEER